MICFVVAICIGTLYSVKAVEYYIFGINHIDKEIYCSWNFKNVHLKFSQ